MKPTSVIFLILSVILIAAGAVTCVASQRMAEANGIDLFMQSTDDDDNGVYTEAIVSGTVTKISISAKEADIIITGGAKESKVTLTNYSAGGYYLGTSNKNMTFEEGLGLMSLFKLSSSGFSFNGLRQYINYDRFDGREKVIEIALTSSDAIKAFDISLEKGSVTISGISTEADYTVSVGEGNVNLSIPGKLSTVDVTVDKGDFNYTNSTQTGTIKAAVKEGNVKAIIREVGTRAYVLKAAAGTVSYFGEDKGAAYESTPVTSQTTTMEITVEKGNIDLEREVTASNVPTTE